jgi:hypothetical protein
MRMSHWIDAPVVKRVDDGATLLDLSEDVWDLCDVKEDGDILVLVIRKYPGHTNGVEVRILPEPERYELGGRNKTREELMSALRALP